MLSIPPTSSTRTRVRLEQRRDKMSKFHILAAGLAVLALGSRPATAGEGNGEPLPWQGDYPERLLRERCGQGHRVCAVSAVPAAYPHGGCPRFGPTVRQQRGRRSIGRVAAGGFHEGHRRSHRLCLVAGMASGAGAPDFAGLARPSDPSVGCGTRRAFSCSRRDCRRSSLQRCSWSPHKNGRALHSPSRSFCCLGHERAG